MFRFSSFCSQIYYAAHDINIYLLRKLLRLNWLTESFNPNQSPPGGFLMFVLYSSPSPSSSSSSSSSSDGTTEGRAQEASGHMGAEAAEAVAGTRYYVKAFFVSQSYRQQREATPLTAADPVRPARNTAQHSTAQHSNEPFQGQFYCKLLLLLLLFARAFT